MTLQEELRQIARMWSMDACRETLRLAARKIDELELKVERLTKEKENQC